MNMKERIQNGEYYFHSQYCLTPLLDNLFCARFSYSRHKGYDFVDTLLAFGKELLLLITIFCIIYICLPHALLFELFFL